MEYAIYLFGWAGCYIVLGYALNILAGYSAINTLAIAGTFGLGAYAFALTLHWSSSQVIWPVSILLALLAALALAAAANLLIALLTLRVSVSHFLATSLALQFMFADVFRNAEITGGVVGISGISLGLSPRATALTVIATASVFILLIVRLLKSRFARTIIAIKDDGQLAQANGIGLLAGKSMSATLSGAIAGLAGALFAASQTYIDPESFDLKTTILAYSIVLIGGLGTRWGPVAGGFIVMMVPEALSLFAFPAEYVGPIRQLLFGLVLLVLTFLRPEGLLLRRPTVKAASVNPSSGR